MPRLRRCLGTPGNRCNKLSTESRCTDCARAMRRARRHKGYDDPRFRSYKTKMRGRPCERCRLRVGTRGHHKDRNPSNNVPSNWEWLCDKCHRDEHA